jgi:hypothetical protein
MVPMTEFTTILHKQIDEVKQIINKNNLIGNSDGLIANYSLQNKKNEFDWKVNCATSEWIEEKSTAIKCGSFNELASLGFSLYLDKSKIDEYKLLFNEGIKFLMGKEPFPEDRVSFVFYPKQFLGIVLGLISTGDQKALSWLQNDIIPQRKKFGDSEKINELLVNLIESITLNKTYAYTVDQIKSFRNVGEASLVLWGAKRNHFKVHLDENELREFKELILESFLTTNMKDVREWCTPFILSSVYDCIFESVNNTILDISHVSKILQNFESAMERWVWTDKNKWMIQNEKDVQSILWLIIRSFFDDAVYEEPTSKFGQGSSILDVKIPNLNLIVEAKFINDSDKVKNIDKFKKIEDEIKIDSIDYLQSTGYKNLIVFVYDNTASVQLHQTTQTALKKIPNVKDVIIASKPSHIKTKSN